MTGDSTEEPTHADSKQVDLEVGHLRLNQAVVDWVKTHQQEYAINGWTVGDAVQDLLTVAYHREREHAADRGDRDTWAEEYRTALAGRTPEQIRAHEHATARLNLLIGMSEVEAGLKAAARLGLRVRWYVEDGKTEVPEPEAWPHPYLGDDDLGAGMEGR